MDDGNGNALLDRCPFPDECDFLCVYFVVLSSSTQHPVSDDDEGGTYQACLEDAQHSILVIVTIAHHHCSVKYPLPLTPKRTIL